MLFLGSDGWLISNYNKHEVGPAALREAYTPPPKSIESSPGHYVEWIRCCKERRQPTCSFDYSGPLTEAVLLANVAYRGARSVKLGWDRKAMRLSGADAVNELLDVEARDGFGV